MMLSGIRTDGKGCKFMLYEVFVSKEKREGNNGFMFGTFFYFNNKKDLFKFLNICLDQNKCFEVEYLDENGESYNG